MLEAAAASSVEGLAAEATFASTLLDPLPGSASTAVDLRQRLLALARPSSRSPDSKTVQRAVQELVLRFPGDSVVHAALKADAARGSLTPFVAACISGHGAPLVSPEIACTLFQWLDADDGVRLAVHMWDPLRDLNEALEERLSPLHIAAARSRADFVAVYVGQEDVDVASGVNALSKTGWSPLGLVGTRTALDPHVTVECALTLVAACAAWGRVMPNIANAMQAAARTGSVDAVRRLLACPGYSPDILQATDTVRLRVYVAHKYCEGTRDGVLP